MYVELLNKDVLTRLLVKGSIVNWFKKKEYQEAWNLNRGRKDQ